MYDNGLNKPIYILPQVLMCDGLRAELLQDTRERQVQRVVGSKQHSATVRQESGDEATLTQHLAVSLRLDHGQDVMCQGELDLHWKLGIHREIYRLTLAAGHLWENEMLVKTYLWVLGREHWWEKSDNDSHCTWMKNDLVAGKASLRQEKNKREKQKKKIVNVAQNTSNQFGFFMFIKNDCCQSQHKYSWLVQYNRKPVFKNK